MNFNEILETTALESDEQKYSSAAYRLLLSIIWSFVSNH